MTMLNASTRFAPGSSGGRGSQSKGAPRGTFVTGRGLRLALLWRSIAMTVLIAAAFAALAYYSDFLYKPFRPAFVAIMAALVFVSRFGTFEADRARGAASLRLMSRSYFAMLLFSLIAISPLFLQGRLYTETLQAVQIKGIEGADINGVEFSPDGKRIVTASDDGTARVWDTATGVLRLTLRGHTNWLWQASFSPDGTRIVTASRDLTARIWDAKTGAPIRTLTGHLASVLDARYLKSGKEIATASADKTVKIWDAETGEVLRTFQGHNARVNGLAVSADGRRIASVDTAGAVRIWNAANGELVASFDVPGANWQDVSFDRAGGRVAAASEDGQAFVWDVGGRRLLQTVNHTTKLFTVAFIAPGELATGGIDGVVRVWRVASGEKVREITGHLGAVRDIALSPDGKEFVTGSRDNSARVWDVASGQEEQIVGHTNPAVKSPWVLDVPPVLYASHAPTPANILKKPEHAGELLGRGLVLALGVLLAGFLVKGVFMAMRWRAGTVWAVVGVLFVGAVYVLAMTLTDLPIEASYLWLIFGFVPAAILSLVLWLLMAALAGMRRRRPAADNRY